MDIPICLKSELDHFQSVPVQTAMEYSKVVQYQPINNSLSGDTISFEVAGTPEEAIDLAHSQLLVDVKIVEAADDSAVSGLGKFAPVNNFLRSLFKGHELWLNNEVVSSMPSYSHYGSYIETLLNYGPTAQAALIDSGWILDKPRAFDNVETTATGQPANYIVNSGMVARKEFLAGDIIWRMFAKLPSDLTNQPLLIPPKIDLKLVLSRSRDAFSLVSSEVPFIYKVKIVAASLRLRKVKLDPEFLIGHEMALQKRNITIPFTETGVLEFGIATGSSTWNRQDVFRGLIPKKVVLGLVESSAINGDLKLNPYNFQIPYIGAVSLYVNGDAVPYKQIQQKPDDTREPYLSLLDATGKLFKDTSLPFSTSDWPQGFGLFGFQLEPEHLDGSCMNARRRGIVEITITFTTPTTKAYSLIIFHTRDAMVEIDSNRNVFLPLKRV